MFSLLGLIMTAVGALILSALILRAVSRVTPAAAFVIGGVLFLLGLLISIATGAHAP